jgi:DNA-binding SARP family transcriptional activator
VYLALAPGRSASRDHLVDLLWSDADPVAGDHAFRQTLWFLRRQVGLDLLRTDSGELALAGPMPSDHHAFLAAIERCDFQAAVALYTGEFLPSFALPGGVEFEHWADAERFRLRSAFGRAAETVVRRHLREGRFREAGALAHRLRDEDPDDERGWRLLLEALTSVGDFVGAVVEAERLERQLSKDDREPEPATRIAIRRARQSPSLPSEPAGRSRLVADLVGREREFSTLIAAWEGVRHGQARHVHVRAQAGLGKTRLLADLRARLRSIGGRVVSVRANPGERALTFAFAGDVAAALAALPGAPGVGTATAGVLVGLNPALSSQFATPPDSAGGEEGLRRRTFALGELIRAVADEAPLALLVDDIHWADPASRRLLAGALARMENSRVLAVTAARPVPEDIAAAGGTEHLDLPPLSEPQVWELVSSLGVLPSHPWVAPFVRELHLATRGSPLLVLESLQLLMDREIVVLGADGWRCADGADIVGQLRSGGALGRRLAEVSPAKRALLVTLALAGTPLDTETVARAASRPAISVAADLDDLEQRGIASREDGRWVPAHDEIAARAIETTDPDAIRTAHAVLGDALAQAAALDPALLPHAAQHLLAGDRPERVASLFHSYARLARRIGDQRSFRELAIEFLGAQARPERTAAMVAALPLSMRTGLTSPLRVAAVVGALSLVVGLAAYAIFRPPPPRPDAILVALPADSTEGAASLSAVIYAARWQQTGVLTLSRNRWLDIPRPPATRGSRVASSPDGTAWAYTRITAADGDRDVFVSDTSGVERPIAPDPRGELSPCWSPDGKWLAFSTERWNPHAWADLATVNLTTGALRQLTSGDATDLACSWSPDGTRIAFVRYAAGETMPGPDRVCWITVDGSSQACHTISGFHPTTPLGWADDETVLVDGRAATDQYQIGRLSFRTGGFEILAARGAMAVEASPDARWLATYERVSGYSEPQWRVISVERPEQVRYVDTPGPVGRALTLAWLGTGAPPYIDRIQVNAPSQAVQGTASVHLSLIAFTTSSAQVAVPPVVRWRSSDTSIAVVDPVRGVLTPRHAGRVTVSASAGGWRSGSAAISIEPSTSWRSLIGEDWSGPLEETWVPWGDPRPLVHRSRDGGWLLPNGDSSGTSGVYSRRAFDAKRGLGIEVQLSTPLTAMQWQYVNLALTTDLDEAALAAWDHRTTPLPVRFNLGGHPYCGAAYPAGDGRSNLLVALLGRRYQSTAAWFPTGRAWTLRIQFFPDGTCGFALNGRVIARDSVGVAIADPMRVVLGGKSVRTSIRIGRVEVWEGIRDGVDWLALDRSAPPP